MSGKVSATITNVLLLLSLSLMLHYLQLFNLQTLFTLEATVGTSSGKNEENLQHHHFFFPIKMLWSWCWVLLNGLTAMSTDEVLGSRYVRQVYFFMLQKLDSWLNFYVHHFVSNRILISEYDMPMYICIKSTNVSL